MDMQNSIDTYLVNFSGFLGINNTGGKDEKIKIYPNPVHDKFVIELDGNDTKNISITLMSVNGSIVKKFDQQLGGTGDGKVEINAADLADGIYLCRVITDHTVIVRQIIKIE